MMSQEGGDGADPAPFALWKGDDLRAFKKCARLEGDPLIFFQKRRFPGLPFCRCFLEDFAGLFATKLSRLHGERMFQTCREMRTERVDFRNAVRQRGFFPNEKL